MCSLQLIRNLFILTRSCNKGGCFLCSSSAKKCVAVAISLVYTTTHAPAVLRWAGRSGSQVKGALALPSAVRLAIAFFFSPPMIRKRTRRRPVGRSRTPVHVAVEEQRLDGEGERTPALPCSPRPRAGQTSGCSRRRPMIPLLLGTLALARRNNDWSE